MVKKKKSAKIQISQNPSPEPNTNGDTGEISYQINISNKLQNWFISIILFFSSLLLFINFPVSQITDGRFMLLLSHNIAFDNTTRLDPYLSYHQEIQPRKGFFYWWWQLSPKRDGKIIYSHDGDWDGKDPLYYRYPNLPSILSIPVVVAMDKLFDIKIVRDGKFSFKDEDVVHKVLAAIICSVILVQIFLLARLMLPLYWALSVAVVSGFGTQIVSTLSRGVWSDTWALLISLFAIHHLLASALGKTKLSPIYLAIISSLAFFCKPNYAVIGIGALIFVVLNSIKNQNYKALYRLLIAGSIGVLIFISYSIYQFGTPIPDYYRPAVEIKYLIPALLGHSFSPSRGLFIYCSFLLMVIYLLIRYWQHNPLKVLTKSTFIPLAILIFVSSAWGTWWGGHSYGPRLIIPLLPWTILLTVIAMGIFYQNNFAKKVVVKTNKNTTLKIESTLLILSALLSIMINVHGAREPKTWLEWFYKPYPVFNDPQTRLWDWSDAQFLAGIKKRSFEE